MKLKLTSVPVPNLPLEEILIFKHENQELLRALRISFKQLFSTYQNIEDCIETMLHQLEIYERSLDSIEKKYEMINFSYFIKSITSLDESFISSLLKIAGQYLNAKKIELSKQQEIASARGRDSAYIYEIIKLNNLQTIIC